MINTENYGLGKPEPTDFYDVNVQNDNMDIIDGELKEHASAIDKLSDDLANYLPLSGGTVNGKINADVFSSNQNKSIAPSNTAYRETQFVANADHNIDDTKRAGYGFHNIGENGAFLYLDTDGVFKFITHGGVTRILATDVDLAKALPKTGGIMTGGIIMSHNAICLGNDKSMFIRSRSANTQLGIGCHYDGTNVSEYLLMQGLDVNKMQLFPGHDNTCDLGLGSWRWKSVYAGTGTIQTSDRTKKTDIVDLETEHAKSFIMGLKPSTYKFADGTSNRTHYGLVAQDVEELMESLDMDSKDFAGFIKSPKQKMVEVDVEVENEVVLENGEKTIEKTIEKTTELQEVEGEYDYSLRYDEFIAPLIKTVQAQQAEIELLKAKIAEIKNNL